MTKEELDKLIFSDPDFGFPDRPAPLGAKALAKKLGVAENQVYKRRKQWGVLNFYSSGDGLTKDEREIYALCALVNEKWGRAKEV